MKKATKVLIFRRCNVLRVECRWVPEVASGGPAVRTFSAQDTFLSNCYVATTEVTKYGFRGNSACLRDAFITFRVKLKR